MRTELGQEIHNHLMKRSEEKLKDQGYQVMKNVTIEGHTIDLVGIRGKEKIGVECLNRTSKKMIEEKMNWFEGHLSKIIFSIPSHTKYKPENSWVFDISIKTEG